MSERPSIQTLIYKIWKLRVPVRVTIFAWLVLQNKILNIDNLINSKQMDATNYLLHGYSAIHSLYCHKASNSPSAFTDESTAVPTFSARLVSRGNNKVTSSIAWSDKPVQTTIWRERCRCIFQGQQKPTYLLAMEITK